MDAVGPVDVELVTVARDSLEGGGDASEPRMLVHPIGRPIIASTNSGLSRRVGFPERSTSFKGRLFRSIVSGLASPLRVSRAAGVGKRAAVRDGPPCLASVARGLVCGSELRLASAAVGVGIKRAERLPSKPPRSRAPIPGGPFESLAIGVGSLTTASVSVVPECLVVSWSRLNNVPELRTSVDVGVGSNFAAARSDGGLEIWFEFVFGACGLVVGVGRSPFDARVNRLFVLPLGRLALSPF